MFTDNFRRKTLPDPDSLGLSGERNLEYMLNSGDYFIILKWPPLRYDNLGNKSGYRNCTIIRFSAVELEGNFRKVDFLLPRESFY